MHLLNALPHDLLEIGGSQDLLPSDQQPAWVQASLTEAPFVVVRRARWLNGLVPVGVRGRSREQRFAAYLAPQSILRRFAPEQLTNQHLSINATRRETVPALAALVSCRPMFSYLVYGPTGSVGFELASGLPTATRLSDLDLLVRTVDWLPLDSARDLVAAVAGFPCRVDVLLETAVGAMSLTEYARGEPSLLVRRIAGPALIRHPLINSG
jgi:phosphoribosyl-dephospho-CoA transferase